ncbi:MAG: radical SAM protein [Humidesulfovibrio sp.]|nr:radical SAM protein [Humidesulfovibrio sp.]
MFHIVLINPPRRHVVELDLPGFVDLGEISSFPPIGLMYLAQALRQESPLNHVTILDCVADGLDAEQTAQKVKELAPDLVGITSFTFTFYDVLETAKCLKAAGVRAPLAIGGPHMYLFGPETMSHQIFDIGVVGDGEEVFAQACKALREGTPIPDLPGLLHRVDGKLTGSGVAQLQGLDDVQIPAIDLIDPTKYYSTLGKSMAVGTICSSRGCPFRCTFCQVPHTPYRTRAVENVVDEMERYVAMGILDFFFFDDLFNITKQRVVDFSKEILRRGLKVSWMFRGRVDQIDEEMMRMAVKAGCHTVSVGVEDATDKGLKAIRKNITIAQAKQAVRDIRKSGARSSTNWILGFPHHSTQADMDQLLRTAIAVDADYAQFSILQCMPGSELYDQAVQEGGLDPDAWRNYVLSPVPLFSPPIWERHFSKEQLCAHYSHMYKRYYMRPRVFIRELLATASFAELFRKVKTFCRFFLPWGHKGHNDKRAKA